MDGSRTAKVSARVAVIGPQDAFALRHNCPFPRQRNIAPLNVRRLALEQRKGRYIDGTPVFICVLPDQRQMVVNANHSLEMVIETGIPQVFTLIFLQVKDEDEVARVYSTLDLHKVRTWADAIRARGLSEDMPLAHKTLAAVGVIMGGFRYSYENVEVNTSRDSRIEVAKTYETEAGAYQQCLAGAPKLNQKVLQRAAVMGVALETLRHQATTAVKFWSNVAQDDALSNGDARKTLLRWLLQHKAGAGVANYLNSKACALAWNAWFQGQGLVTLRPVVHSKFVLLGTPWAIDPKAKKGGDGEPGPRHRPSGPLDADEAESILPELFETGVQADPTSATGTTPVVRFKKGAT